MNNEHKQYLYLHLFINKQTKDSNLTIVLMLSIYAYITFCAFPDRFKFLADRFAVAVALVLHEPDIQPQMPYVHVLANSMLTV